MALAIARIEPTRPTLAPTAEAPLAAPATALPEGAADLEVCEAVLLALGEEGAEVDAVLLPGALGAEEPPAAGEAPAGAAEEPGAADEAAAISAWMVELNVPDMPESL